MADCSSDDSCSLTRNLKLLLGRNSPPKHESNVSHACLSFSTALQTLADLSEAMASQFLVTFFALLKNLLNLFLCFLLPFYEGIPCKKLSIIGARKYMSIILSGILKCHTKERELPLSFLNGSSQVVSGPERLLTAVCSYSSIKKVLPGVPVQWHFPNLQVARRKLVHMQRFRSLEYREVKLVQLTALL